MTEVKTAGKAKIAKAEKVEKPLAEVIPKHEEKAIAEIIESKDIAAQDMFGKLTRKQIDLMKRTIAKGATDDELSLFIQVCKGAQLNPFLKQVHFVKRWDSKEGKEVGAIQVGIDGFRSIAESSGKYAGSDDAIFSGELFEGENKVPEKATVTIYKIIEGVRCPFTATARWTEYVQKFKDKKTDTMRANGMWTKMPYNQLAKCAEALALRKAFPKLLSGMYVPEEMDQAGAPVGVLTADKAIEKLKQALQKATDPAIIKEYMEKMNKSDKYSKEQKEEYEKLAYARLTELQQNADAKAVS